jgi:hypothetical protein
MLFSKDGERMLNNKCSGSTMYQRQLEITTGKTIASISKAMVEATI